MASSIPPFKNPYHVCKQDCYFSLDEDCMQKCENIKSTKQVVHHSRLLNKSKGTIPYVMGVMLLVLGGGVMVYSIISNKK